MTRLTGIALACAFALEAQGPKIGVVEIFGARKTPAAQIRKALGVTEGGTLPSSKQDTEDRLEAIDGVVRASLEAVCCEEGRAILYVGVAERGSPHFNFNTPPHAELTLPPEIEKEWTEFITAIAIAARTGDIAEDLTQGHSLMAQPDARRTQLRFVELAAKHQAVLIDVIRKAEDETQRAIAAFVLGYAKDKKRAATELQYAMQDSDVTVRDNAMRALSAIIVYARLHPDDGIRVPATWFVEMLGSTQFTDRIKAASALVTLTEQRDESAIALLRERAVPSLEEMASWRHLPHALPAFILLGRAGGMAEEKIQDAWKAGRRDEVIRAAKEAVKHK